MKRSTIQPRFRAQYGSRKHAQHVGPIRETEAEARQDIKPDATFAAILRDSQGADHPDNKGKFFLHRYVRA